MNQEQLYYSTRFLLQAPRGILDLDDSPTELQELFSEVGLEASELRRHHYRRLLLDTPQIDTCVSGIVLHRETLLHLAGCESHEVYPVHFTNMLVGIRADTGTVPMPQPSGEPLSDGMENLIAQLKDARGLGARFAQWESVFQYGDALPSTAAVHANIERQALFVGICQDIGVVPVVSIKLNGQTGSTPADQHRALRHSLGALMKALDEHAAWYPGLILRLPLARGASNAPEADAQSRDITLEILDQHLPEDLGGVVFREGELEVPDAERRMAITCEARSAMRWPNSFCFGRAIQRVFIDKWRDNPAEISAAQCVLKKELRTASDAVTHCPVTS